MWWKAIAVWLLFMVGAIANGTLRIKIIIPVTGEPVGHLISTALLCLIILGITWLTISFLGPDSAAKAWAIGAIWLLMTLAFEFGVGYFIGHHSWPEMLADYNVLKGRVWLFVPLITLLAPWWMAKLRGLLP